MNSQIERGTALEMVHTIAFRAGVLERILQRPVLGGLEIRADELAYVQLLQQQIDDLCRYLNLPFVEPERKKGYWIVKDEDWRKQLEWDECSECGFTATKQYNFCPNCGADMTGE